MKHLRKIIGGVLLVVLIILTVFFIKEKKDGDSMSRAFYTMTQSFYTSIDAQLCIVDFIGNNIDSIYQCDKYVSKSIEDYINYSEYFDSESDYDYIGK